MFQLDNALITSDIVEEFFACDLSKCKGACCVEGDLGAPLDEEELDILDDEYERIKPFLSKEGIKVIEKTGKYILDEDDEFSTPLINGRECAYVIKDEKGVTKCGIEQAFFAGETNFRKPISCHLYPIRISKLSNGLEAINYDKWPICDEARVCGKSSKMPLYQFVKESLIRKYGEEWYEGLIAIAKERKCNP